MPGKESWILECAGERKGDWPRERAILEHSGEISGGLLWSLAAREENDAGEFRRNVVFEHFGGGVTDFFWDRLSVELFAGENHIDFENTGTEIDAEIF